MELLESFAAQATGNSNRVERAVLLEKRRHSIAEKSRTKAR